MAVTPSFRLDNQIAIVTGSGSGMGRAFAQALAESGADVVITELPGREALAAETAGVVQALGRRALTISLDVTQVASIRAMVEQVVAKWGHIDILINNAGMNIRKWAVDVTEQDWDIVIDTDLRGVFFCAQIVGKQMIQRGKGGRIINTASQVGLVGYTERVAYCAAKAGVINLTRVLAIEWAQYGITVNAIAPTFVNTPLVAALLKSEEIRQEVLSRIPLGRLAEPEDIVGAILYLASPAAAMVTGHTLVIDGGWTAI
ncbi:2-dehydro-3-deoxy-D-gluconate 5-dehydrogenase [Anaerolineae bacterium]|nr:2-dehydro-3-deoxy-D-gluconate 5-dehydrogenase [Anaerolineae bacterium]